LLINISYQYGSKGEGISITKQVGGFNAAFERLACSMTVNKQVVTKEK
jgi:hypothetical protein